MKWEPMYKRLLALEAQGYSQNEIARMISEEVDEKVTRDMVRHALERARESILTIEDMPKPDRIPYVTKYMDYICGDKKPEPKNWGARANIYKKANAKVLVHADLHIPFHDEEKIEDSISKHRDADVYIAVADVMDCYSQSRFLKGQDMPFIFEIDETLRFFEYISQTFRHVEILEANHEDRVRKTIEKMLPPEIQFLARKNILSVLSAPFPNIVVHSDLWFFQFGSGLFSHPEKNSKVELRAAADTYQHFVEWERAYGLNPWNVIVVAHTHQMGVAYMSHAKVIEIGCLSTTQPYVFNPKIPYKHPASNGYAVMHMNYGVFDENKCREYRYPQGVLL